MKINTRIACITFITIVSVFFMVRVVTIMLEGEEGRLKRIIYKSKRLAEKESLIGLPNQR